MPPVASGMPHPDSFIQAAKVLRGLDPDRYAASLVIPEVHRAAVQALYAFNAEIAVIRERVSAPGAGEIRLQWWADALRGEGYGAVTRHPVADALLVTLEEYELPSEPLLRLLAARRLDLYNDPMPDIGQFEGYAGETTSTLFQYVAMILSGGRAETAAEACGHLGVAQALAGHLLAFGFNAARGQIFLPLSVFAAHGVSEADIHAGRDSEGLSAALSQIRELAEGHADKARNAVPRLSRQMRPGFAPIALVDRDLRSLARRGGTVFTAPRRRSAFRRLLALTVWTIRND